MANVVMMDGPEASLAIPKPREIHMRIKDRNGIHRSPNALSANLLIPFSVVLNVMF